MACPPHKFMQQKYCLLSFGIAESRDVPFLSSPSLPYMPSCVFVFVKVTSSMSCTFLSDNNIHELLSYAPSTSPGSILMSTAATNGAPQFDNTVQVTSERSPRPVTMYDTKNGTTIEYKSVMDASRNTKISYGVFRGAQRRGAEFVGKDNQYRVTFGEKAIIQAFQGTEWAEKERQRHNHSTSRASSKTARASSKTTKQTHTNSSAKKGRGLSGHVIDLLDNCSKWSFSAELQAESKLHLTSRALRNMRLRGDDTIAGRYKIVYDNPIAASATRAHIPRKVRPTYREKDDTNISRFQSTHISPFVSDGSQSMDGDGEEQVALGDWDINLDDLWTDPEPMSQGMDQSTWEADSNWVNPSETAGGVKTWDSEGVDWNIALEDLYRIDSSDWTFGTGSNSLNSGIH
jgi:hypothetical protein